MRYQRECERRLRVGFVGAGSHAYRNLLPALAYLPVELVAVCDRAGEVARATAAQYGAAAHDDLATMLARERLEAVMLCVGAEQHPRLALAALAAGLHVWMEKPAAASSPELAELIAARGERTVVVGLKKLFMPALRKARELAADPAFGPLRTLIGEYPVDLPPPGERGGDWLGNGCHPLSALVGLAGEAEALTAHRGRHGGGALTIEFASGALGVLHLAAGAPGTQPCERYRLIGQRRAITIANSRRVELQRGIDAPYGRATTFAPPGTDHGAVVWEAQDSYATLEGMPLFTQGMHAELEHFCERALAGQAASEGTLEQALHVMRLYEAALEPAGRRVPIPG